MAISHICHPCGYDLAHEHPHDERHYGLRVIRCPQCAAVSVRRRHPLVNIWRGILRFDVAAGLLVIAMLMVPAMVLLTLSSMAGVIQISRDIMLRAGPATDGLTAELIFVIIVMIGGTGLLIGGWLTVAFAHWGQRQVIAWLAWMCAILVILMGIAAIPAMLPEPQGLGPTARHTTRTEVLMMNWRLFTLPAAGIFGLMMVAAVGGIPLGRLWLRLWVWLRRKVWRRRLRRRRRARVRD